MTLVRRAKQLEFLVCVTRHPKAGRLLEEDSALEIHSGVSADLADKVEARFSIQGDRVSLQL
jgi:hypothetical protein